MFWRKTLSKLSENLSVEVFELAESKDDFRFSNFEISVSMSRSVSLLFSGTNLI